MTWWIYPLCAYILVCAIATGAFYVNEKRVWACIFKLAASVGFMLIGILSAFSNPDDLRYSAIVLSGLVFCTAGDVMLMLKELFEEKFAIRFMLGGVLFFGAAQVLFSSAMIADVGKFNFWLLPFLLIVPLGILLFHRMHVVTLDRYGVVMIIYGALISMSFLSALNGFITLRSDFYIAMLFALAFFMISDSALLYTYYGSDVNLKRMLNYVVMVFYYIAMILISFSVTLKA